MYSLVIKEPGKQYPAKDGVLGWIILLDIK